MTAGYDVAQICRNGHVITSSARTMPQFMQNYCDKCGQPTMTKCEKCGADIRGSYEEFFSSRFDTPAYCHNCGSPYPWTQSRLDAFDEMLEEFAELDASDKDR